MGDNKATAAKIRDEIVDFVLANFISKYDKSTLPLDQSLVDIGVMDSFGIVELVSFIEEKWTLAIPDSDITREKIGSVDKIADLVLRRLNG